MIKNVFEKVNPSHPDLVADRIGGAIVDLAYANNDFPKVAVEVMIGAGKCFIIVQTTEDMTQGQIEEIVYRIAGEEYQVHAIIEPQDIHLTNNQDGLVRAGDNGIFKGLPITETERKLSEFARELYKLYPSDGKFILDNEVEDGRLVISQSYMEKDNLKQGTQELIDKVGAKVVDINPLGYWTGGPSVDVGCTNRKLGSDMAQAVTGGGLCLSGDTEYLTEDMKWERLDNYKGEKVGQWNDGVLEFVEPHKYIYNKSDKFVHFTNSTKVSMLTTLEHEMLVRTSKGKLIKHTAEHLTNKLESGSCNMGQFIHNFTYGTPKGKMSEQDIRLQVAFCADGSLIHEQNIWTGRIRVKKSGKIERLRMLLEGKKYKETKDGDYSIFWVQPPVYTKSLYDSLKDEDFKIIYDEMFNWDGDVERRLFRTTIKEEADFAQLVIMSQGKTATITQNDRRGQIQMVDDVEYERKSIEYSVNELQSTTTTIRTGGVKSTLQVERIEKEQPSYCFTVPSSNLIVRHNDMVYVTGNCGKDLSKADVTLNIYAHLKAQELGEEVLISCAIGDEYIDGKPYAEIVEIARDFINEIGGFEKFAEWGLF